MDGNHFFLKDPVEVEVVVGVEGACVVARDTMFCGVEGRAEREETVGLVVCSRGLWDLFADDKVDLVQLAGEQELQRGEERGVELLQAGLECRLPACYE